MRNQNNTALLQVLEHISFLPTPQALVAAIVPDVSNPFFTQLAFELGRRLRQDGLTLIACSSEGSHAREMQLAGEIRRLNVRGLLLCSVGSFSHTDQQFLEELQIPILQIDRYDATLPYSGIRVDNVLGAELVAKYLKSKGHQRVAFLGGPHGIEGAALRSKGFEQACKTCGLELSLAPRGDFSFQSGYIVGKSFLPSLKSNDITAVFCANDAMAIGLLRSLVEGSVSVPDEVAVIGFDAIPMGDWTTPTLTSVEQSLADIAEKTVLLLQQILGGEPTVGRGQIVSVSPRLVIRASA